MQETSNLLWGELREASEQGAPLPIRHTELEATLLGPLAKVTITQHFYNPRPVPIEVVYVLPLSQQGAVSGLALWVGGRCIRGVIKEKEEAREQYEEARQRGAHAAHVTQERPNLFTLSVANVQPNEAVRVELSLEEVLPFEGGRWRLIVPLTYVPPYRPKDLPAEPWMSAPFIVAPRARAYDREPTNAAQAPTLSVFIQGSFATPLSAVRGVSFAVEELSQSLDEGVFSLQLAASKEPPDRDFIVEIWPLSQKIAPVLLSHKPREKTGTFLLTLLPEQTPTPESFAPREVAFILDRSGSMSGAPINQARSALQGCLRALGPNDTFSILAFDDRLEELCPAPLYWSQQTIDEADAYLSTINARGGTEIVPALTRVLNRPQDPLRQRLVVFLTDGAVANEQQAISLIEKSMGGARAYAFGIGGAVNRALLDSLAKAGRGVAEYITNGQDIEDALLRFQTHTAGPLLTDLTITGSPAVLFEVLPRPLPDLFAGQALQVLGRWTGDEPVQLTITGRRGGQRLEGQLTLSAGEDLLLGAPLNRLWAKRRVEQLSDELRRNPREKSAIRSELIGLGVLHHIVTPFTSLVAVEEESQTRSLQPAERVSLPNLLPRGLDRAAFSVGWLSSRQELTPSQSDFAPRHSSGFRTSQAPPPAAPRLIPAPSSNTGGALFTRAKTGGGIFSRIASLLKSNVNDAISKAEDPEKMLNQVIVEMNEQLVEAKKQVAVAIADEKRLAKQYEGTAANSREWEKKAIMASNDEDLVKEAMAHKAEQDRLSAEYQKQHALQKDAADTMKTALRGLSDKILEASRKKDLLIARTKRAEAQGSIQKTLGGLSDASAFETFDRMAQKVDQVEAEAEAQGDLSHDAFGGGVDEKFARPEASAGSDDALSTLKAKLGAGTAADPKPVNKAKPSSFEAKATLPIAQDLRVLGRTQRASGAWGEGKDELAKTCLALVQMAAGKQTHRAGAFQTQLARTMAYLQTQQQTAVGNDLLLLAWALYAVYLATGHPADHKLWQEVLIKLSDSDGSDTLRLVRGAPGDTVATLLAAGMKLFFG